jgi:hypothetical protein
MNERIFELAEQAHEETYRAMGSTCLQEAFDDFYTEKFAELIVRECIELAMNERLRYSSSYDKQADWAKKLMMLHCATSMDNYKILLQEHFGVEE